MKADGVLDDKTRDKVRAFLNEFDGDILGAAHALRIYADDMRRHHREEQKVVSTPIGRVLLSATNIRKTYKIGRQKLEVLKGVSLAIHEGEFVAITGASGSGKSTLLQLIGGLDKPTSGEILFQGEDLARLSDKKLSEFRRKTIGFVFQFFYLQPFLRLRRNLAVPGMFAHDTRQHQREQATELAKSVGLGDRLDHYPKELSGGQIQRAAIARALFNQPQVLLADEPTGNLDSENGMAIIELFEKIRREFGMTVVIVTHDREIAARADRVIRMKDGVVV